MVELGGEFGGQGGVSGGVVGVVVLVGPVGAGEFGEQLAQPGQTGGLPAALDGRTVHEFQADAVGAQQLPHRRLEFAVADQHDRVSEGLAREGEADTEGAGGRLHHRGAWAQFTALAGAQQHRHGRPRLHPAGREPFQFGPEPRVCAGQVGGDVHDGCPAEQGEQLGAGDGAYGGGGHRSPPG